MLHLITGTPGAGKTLFAVSLIVKYEDSNERALIYNAAALKHNKQLIEKNNLAEYFAFVLLTLVKRLKNKKPFYLSLIILIISMINYALKTFF